MSGMSQPAELSAAQRELVESWRDFAHQPMGGDARAQLVGFLDYQRATVVLKAAGLTDEQARQSLVPSKLTTVAAIVSHLRWVEESWFAVRLAGEPELAPYADGVDPDADFRVAEDIPLATLISDYLAQCQHSNEIVAARELADAVPFRDNGPLNVRWVLAHMIEETARHAGHLDLLREQLDGETGE